MRDFPKWMLVLAGVNLLPLFFAPIYLFGGLRPFGTTTYGVVNFLLYLLANLLWVLPVLLFFVSLDYYRRGYERVGVCVACLGIAVTATCIILPL